jgi:hypothetical protein
MGDAKSGPVRLSFNPQLRVGIVRSLNATPGGLNRSISKIPVQVAFVSSNSRKGGSSNDR